MSDEQPVNTEQSPVDQRNPEDKVPGLELTWGMVEAMEMDEAEEKNFISAAQQAKQSFRSPQFIFLAGRPYIHRTVNRREMSKLRTDVALRVNQLAENAPEGLDPQQARAQLMKDTMEEALVEACSIYPKYDRVSIREEDAGIITSLHDSIVEASGYNQPASPIRL